MAVNAFKKLSEKTGDEIRYTAYIYNSVERETEGKRTEERNKEREGEEIGELAREHVWQPGSMVVWLHLVSGAALGCPVSLMKWCVLKRVIYLFCF